MEHGLYPLCQPSLIARDLPSFPKVKDFVNPNAAFPKGQIIKSNLILHLDATIRDDFQNPKMFVDRTGQESHCVLTTGADYNQQGVGSVDFNGSTGFGEGVPLEPRFYTISVWFKPTGPPSVNNDAGGGVLICANRIVGSCPYLLSYSWLDQRIYFGQSGQGINIATANNRVLRNKVVCVTVLLSSVARSIYLNGILEFSSGWSSFVPYPASGNRNYRIGQFGGSGYVRPFNGDIYQVLMYNRALADMEILHNYNVLRPMFPIE